MSEKQRRHFTAVLDAAMVRRHLIDRVQKGGTPTLKP